MGSVLQLNQTPENKNCGKQCNPSADWKSHSCGWSVKVPLVTHLSRFDMERPSLCGLSRNRAHLNTSSAVTTPSKVNYGALHAGRVPNYL